MQNRARGQIFAYEEWMEKEGIPVYKTFASIDDLAELPRRPWARMGGKGTFIELEGTKQAFELLYVAEIPAGGALEPEKHLYNETLYILRGRGLAEVWHEGQAKRTFEWGEGSMFAIPLNAWHRLVNGGREPVLFFAQTSAPLLMQALGDTEFVFNCDHNFTNRFSGGADYFQVNEKLTFAKEGLEEEGGQRAFLDTNFVPDVRSIFVGDHVSTFKVAGGRQTGIRMAGGSGGHTSEWPAGMYHKAHYHGPGATILGLRSEGYVLIWHKQYGPHPFQDGYADKVLKAGWKPGSIYSPPNEWFHQHFNTGKEPARHLANTGISFSTQMPTITGRRIGGYGAGRNVRDGGVLIEYEDEDPEIRRMFERELAQKGIKCAMPPVVYRTEPFDHLKMSVWM